MFNLKLILILSLQFCAVKINSQETLSVNGWLNIKVLYDYSINNMEEILLILKKENQTLTSFEKLLTRSYHKNINMNNLALEKLPTFKNMYILKLNAKMNKITAIYRYTFQNIQMKELNLMHNNIAGIDDGSFDNVQTVNLYGNKLNELKSKWFKKPDLISTLYVGRNFITNLAAGIFNEFTNLVFLDLSHNPLHQLPDGIFPLNNYYYLNLNNITITKLPATVFSSNYVKIDEFDIAFNRLNYLSDAFKNKINAKRILIVGNPWQCSCLWNIHKWITEQNNTLFQYNIPIPICVASKTSGDHCIEQEDHEMYEIYTNYSEYKRIADKNFLLETYD